jgi:NAD(P)-dependent dehydrogenase (short-subunit alcohol dehydrogenase family)
MIRLDGKKALITGGSRGIGRATAILFARAGADVAVNFARRETAAKEVKEKIERLGRECVMWKANIAQKKEVDEMVRSLHDRWGRIDILVNNAGIWTYGEMGNMDESVWAETMGLNLNAVFYACNAVVPMMKKNKRGWIVNVASPAAVRGEALHSHYAASKGALISLTKSLSTELAPFGIRVNCVAPGWVDTRCARRSFGTQSTGGKWKKVSP